MTKSSKLACVALIVSGLLATGCGSSGSDSSTATTATEATAAGSLTVPDGAEPAEGPDFSSSNAVAEPIQAGDDLDSVLYAALDSQQAFWVDTFPAIYGADFAPLPESRMLPLGAGEDMGSETCDGQVIGFDIAAENAVALSCGAEGEMILWDPTSIIKTAADANGPLASAAILAHEFGHVVQYQSGTDLGSPYSELQADCFAGSWVAAVAADPPAGLEGFSDPAAVDATLSGIIDLRDPVGSSADDEDAHGSGFDRVRSFQEGFENGAQHCAGYLDQPPTVTQVPFIDQADADTGGNLPIDELVPLATADLDNYYGVLIDGWEPLGSLEAADLEAADPDAYGVIAQQAEQTGDGAAMLLLGSGWASSVQTVLGEDVGRDATGLQLQAACLVGDWMGHAFFDGPDAPTAGDLSLSPGDLDEAIIGLINLYTANGGGEAGGLFELVSAYRTGVLDGSDACLT